MKRTILFAAVAVLFSGTAFAAGETSGTGAESGYQSQSRGGTAGQGTEEQMRRDEAATSEYRGMDVKELQQRFSQLDKDHDGQISYQEAQADPQFVKYWDEQNLSKDMKIDMAEFARFEFEIETGQTTFQPAEQNRQAAPDSSRSE